MKQEIKIPAMGESVTEASIGSFLKPTGSQVKENEEIVELETEKVNQVLYAPSTGVLTWTVQEGDTVKIGQNIGFVDSEGKAEAKAEPKEEPKKPQEEAPKEPPQKASKPSSGAGQRIMTKEFVQDLKQPEPKKIEKEEQPKPSKTAAGTVRKKMSRIRQTIATRLVDSLHSAAMLTTFNEVDMTEIMHLREKYRDSFMEKHGIKLGFMSFFVKAVVDGLKHFPDLNSYIEGDEIVTRTNCDIGIAVGTERGLVVPVVRECDKLSFPQIEKQIAQFAKRARDGKLTIADLENGGFTITNGGVYGSLLSTPILNPPQVGILGMHKIEKRAVVVEDQIVIRPMMYLALSYDHRLIDGKEAVSFLVHIKEVLEDPSRLMFFADV